MRENNVIIATILSPQKYELLLLGYWLRKEGVKENKPLLEMSMITFNSHIKFLYVLQRLTREPRPMTMKLTAGAETRQASRSTECDAFLFTHEIIDNFGFHIRWHRSRSVNEWIERSSCVFSPVKVHAHRQNTLQRSTDRTCWDVCVVSGWRTTLLKKKISLMLPCLES